MLAVLVAVALADPPPAEVWVVGRDRGRGNLLGVQAWMTTADYATVDAFEARLDGWLAQAAGAGLVQPETVVVFPEYLGTWLVAAGEGPKVVDAPTLDDAMRALVRRHRIAFASRWLSSVARDRAVDAIFHLRGEAMASAWDGVMSRMATRYGVTVVGGSILLPEPRIEDGHVVVRRGRLENVSAVWGPDGRAIGLSRKVRPTADEQPFVRAGELEDLAVVDTPAGRLGVLVCADSWYPEAWEQLGIDLEIVAVPGFLSKDGAWAEPWQGYDGAPAPDDVPPGDVGRLTEGEAWVAHAIGRRGPPSTAEAGVNVFLRGRLWDLGDDGRPLALLGEAVAVGPEVDAPVLVGVWLGPEPVPAAGEEAAEAAAQP